ncbi:MocR-like pyridoxine biosynthesis transcription factor PdxR [Vibrio methylphosphonaticus]|uniref:MocR-like pyridoxine biosynthesis transcription factor PdxR n=1 Tax=Vibrio methylphosphonaticus TaxID=2946866 RepID=UPI002029DC54|nr:PLP-dependent aminotransferase family protein [Vibrio methylphosphonaticus]MCL9776929.1 PLP-dependent aminotransferase family protein [Vibrio methylphosphonaticus]
MADIDTANLVLVNEGKTLQQALFEQIRERILCGSWLAGARLPSTRALALELNVSRNTVIHTYDQLLAEGYLVSKAKSGFFVAVTPPDKFLTTIGSKSPASQGTNNSPNNGLFAPGVADFSQFPTKQWNRYLQRHVGRSSLLGTQDLQGLIALREALAAYLTSSRSVECCADQVIVTSGAQQSIAIALLVTQSASTTRPFLVESPGYKQVVKVLDLFNINYDYVTVSSVSGLDVDAVLSSSASGVYLTPSNQYPMGCSLNTDQRLQLIEWAKRGKRWIIEDDYDSEFQFDSRPFRSMQGLAAHASSADQVIYIGSTSKVMFNALRLGYMVVPKHLVARCLEVKDALSGDTPSQTQAALADFISEGGLVRHIRKMRRIYEAKFQVIKTKIKQRFSGDWVVVSQGAGLHITVEWRSKVDEVLFANQAEQRGVVVRPMRFYRPEQDKDIPQCEGRNGAIVLGFGNAAIDDIAPSINQLSILYYQLLNDLE